MTLNDYLDMGYDKEAFLGSGLIASFGKGASRAVGKSSARTATKSVRKTSTYASGSLGRAASGLPPKLTGAATAKDALIAKQQARRRAFIDFTNN